MRLRSLGVAFAILFIALPVRSADPDPAALDEQKRGRHAKRKQRWSGSRAARARVLLSHVAAGCIM